MKIRKGRKKYLVVRNHITCEVVLARPNGKYDYTISKNELGISMYNCTFKEAKHNIRLLIDKGYKLVVKKY